MISNWYTSTSRDIINICKVEDGKSGVNVQVYCIASTRVMPPIWNVILPCLWERLPSRCVLLALLLSLASSSLLLFLRHELISGMSLMEKKEDGKRTDELEGMEIQAFAFWCLLLILFLFHLHTCPTRAFNPDSNFEFPSTSGHCRVRASRQLPIKGAGQVGGSIHVAFQLEKAK